MEHSPGSVLPVAPSVAPGSVAAEPADRLALARERYLVGDYAGVIGMLTPWLDARRGPYGRTRASGQLLLGVAYMAQQEWNLASASFTRVRLSGGPLASYGAWYEALVDHERNRHTVAARECAAYREKWPEGPMADECLLLMGDAYAAAGLRSASIQAYRTYLEHNPDTPRTEEIELATALAVAQSSPEQGIPLLQQQVLDHSWHSTAMTAQAALDDLAAEGFDTALPTDIRAQMRAAESARRCGHFDDAWEMFQAIADQAGDDPTISAWVDAAEDRFAWGTRRYDVYAASLVPGYEANPDSETAWRIFRAWTRAGDWKQAVAWGRKGIDAHGSTGRWRGARDDLAWAEMYDRQWEAASDRWAELVPLGGSFGRDARFYSALSALQAGRLEQAEAGFDTLVSQGREWSEASLWWRGKVHAARGETDLARADFERAAAEDKTGWYRLLLTRSETDDRLSTIEAEEPEAWVRHDGSWRGGTDALLPELAPLDARPAVSSGIWPTATALVPASEVARSSPTGPRLMRPALLPPERPTAVDWAGLAWPPAADSPKAKVATDARPISAPELEVVSGTLPDGYQACGWYDPVAAGKSFYRLAEAWEPLFPTMPAAYDLIAAGLFTDSARLVSAVYEEWRAAQDATGPLTDRQQQLRAISMTLPQWRELFLYARDHYHASRFCYGLDKYADSEDDRLSAERLAYPVVRADELWPHGRRYGVDPFLMLGVMRQESTYHNTALSPTGAIGLVQVMPRTGARIAALLHEERYSPGALEDPAVNLRYGTFYMSLLLQRFDGVFPLAVASYNGGPHNVSRWMRNLGDIELDTFVELIQYQETRDYVKKVSGYYARYTWLYGEDGSAVVLPERLAGDHPEVVDF